MHGKLCSQQGNEREISGESDTMGNLRRPMGQWDFNTLVRTVRKSWNVTFRFPFTIFPFFCTDYVRPVFMLAE